MRVELNLAFTESMAEGERERCPREESVGRLKGRKEFGKPGRTGLREERRLLGGSQESYKLR
jgi:hypothetical protein